MFNVFVPTTLTVFALALNSWVLMLPAFVIYLLMIPKYMMKSTYEAFVDALIVAVKIGGGVRFLVSWVLMIASWMIIPIIVVSYFLESNGHVILGFINILLAIPYISFLKKCCEISFKSKLLFNT